MPLTGNVSNHKNSTRQERAEETMPDFYAKREGQKQLQHDTLRGICSAEALGNFQPVLPREDVVEDFWWYIW